MIERALQVAALPEVVRAHQLWMEAKARHELEPRVVTLATIEILRERWVAQVREGHARLAS